LGHEIQIGTIDRLLVALASSFDLEQFIEFLSIKEMKMLNQ